MPLVKISDGCIEYDEYDFGYLEKCNDRELNFHYSDIIIIEENFGLIFDNRENLFFLLDFDPHLEEFVASKIFKTLDEVLKVATKNKELLVIYNKMKIEVNELIKDSNYDVKYPYGCNR